MPALRRLTAAATVAVLAGSLGACGKAGSPHASSGGPARSIAAVAAPGAISVATRNTTRLGGADAIADAAAVARTVYPALTPATRPRAVVLVDRADLAASLAASVLAGSPLHAPILYSEGTQLPDLTSETLTALRPTGEPSLGGAQVVSIGAGAPAGFNTKALGSGGPALIAGAVEQLLVSLEPGSPPSAVIVLPAQAPAAMQMPAAGLAAQTAAPILYVESGTVPAVTASTIASLRHPSIFVVDAAAIAPSTLAQLRKLGAVTTVSTGTGEEATPAGNAVAVARYTNGTFGWGVKEPGHGLVIANSTRPLDAAAAAPLSATGDYAPLLLVETPNTVPPELKTYLSNIQPAYTSAPQFRPVRGVYNHGWLIGDESAISATAQAEIDSLLEISPRRQSPEETSVQQAE